MNAELACASSASEPAGESGTKDVTKAASKTAPSGAVLKSPKIAPFPGERPDIPHVELPLSIKTTAAALLVGTPTFVVPTQTLNSFAATDFPLIVVTDHNGIIRSVQVAPDNAMVQAVLSIRSSTMSSICGRHQSYRVPTCFSDQGKWDYPVKCAVRNTVYPNSIRRIKSYR